VLVGFWRFGSLAPARRRLVVGVLALVVGVVLVAAVVGLVTPSGVPASARVRQDVAGPVLLVPGYGGAVASLQPLADVLRRAGRRVEIVRLPGDATGDLAVQARALGVAVRTFMSTVSAASVDVVGYSAGGVVARLWARYDGGASVARRIVSIGSPQHGTQLASLGALLPGACPTACQQLTPGSAVLGGLNSGDETTSGPAWVSIWTSADDVVVPPDSARLVGATNVTVQSICPSDPVTHGRLPADPVVQQIVLGALATTVAVPPPGC